MKYLAVCLLVAAVVGCTDQSQPLSPDFGNAVHANIAAQVVNPEPNTSTEQVTDGRNVNNAFNRYVKGAVIPPIPAMQTLKYGDAPVAPPAVPLN